MAWTLPRGPMAWAWGGGGRKNRSMENGADRNVSWYGCEGAVAEKNIDYR